ncbi:alpha/beta hydrolase [Patulibacter minatonensis]|uniref:alpha/beta hydrolase n=1 Tax=Patulibacter minatonensis TaxID=298163 RepID=UPI00047D8687|nr:alpha/beta hydrolase [Patulibacter minatonensis]
MTYETTDTTGTNGKIVVHRWTPDGDVRGLVVLAHGIGEHAARYDHVAKHLNGDGYVVVAPDHQAHGLSDGTPGLIEDLEVLVDDYATVFAAAREEFSGVPVVALGHSMGGLITTRAMQRGLTPADAWVLSGPVVGGNPGIFALLDMDPIPEVPIDPGMLSRDDAVGEAYAADPLIYHGPLIRPTLLSLKTAVEVIAAADPIGDVPTLYLHGEEDPLAPYEISKAAMEGLGLSNLEQKSYPGARHEIFNETNQDEVLADVSAYLRKTL